MRPVASYNTVSSLTLEDISKFFHMPINEVSEKLGVCATVLKKICRRNGISRWPHRKIKSLDRVIASWEFLQPKTEEEAHKITEELKMLKAKRALLLRPPQRQESVKEERERRTAAPKQIATSSESEEDEKQESFAFSKERNARPARSKVNVQRYEPIHVQPQRSELERMSSPEPEACVPANSNAEQEISMFLAQLPLTQPAITSSAPMVVPNSSSPSLQAARARVTRNEEKFAFVPSGTSPVSSSPTIFPSVAPLVAPAAIPQPASTIPSLLSFNESKTVSFERANINPSYLSDVETALSETFLRSDIWNKIYPSVPRSSEMPSSVALAPIRLA